MGHGHRTVAQNQDAHKSKENLTFRVAPRIRWVWGICVWNGHWGGDTVVCTLGDHGGTYGLRLLRSTLDGMSRVLFQNCLVHALGREGFGVFLRLEFEVAFSSLGAFAASSDSKHVAALEESHKPVIPLQVLPAPSRIHMKI